MSNQNQDPQAPGHGAGAPETDSNGPASTIPRDQATAAYTQQAAEGTQSPEAPGPSPVDALQAEIADLKDQLLRAYAEMDNIRKRGERERLDTQKYAVSKFARDMLAVADNLERALAAVPAGSDDPILKGLMEGVMVTERGLASTLERYGIKRIVAEGALFDPHQHEAVMEQQDPSVPSGTIVRVFEAGYTIEDRVLRPASVVVAKGGPRPDKSDKSTPSPTPQAAESATMPEAGNDNASTESAEAPSANTAGNEPTGGAPDDGSESAPRSS